MTSPNIKNGTYVTTILEAEEGKPLTKQRGNLTDVVSTTSVQFTDAERSGGKTGNLNRKKANVQVVYVASNASITRRYRDVCERRFSRRKRPRNPAFVIIVIAAAFLFLLLSVVIVSLYFATLPHQSVTSVETKTPATTSSATFNTTFTVAPTTGTSFGPNVSETYQPDTTQLPSPTLATSPVNYTSPSATLPPTTVSPSTYEQTTPEVESTTQCIVTTTNVERTADDIPIFYINGPFNYDEALEACAEEGRKLALREDMTDGYNAGYNRCSFGWLRDMHIGMIMQQDFASMDCERGNVGAIYKAARDPDEKYSGAYCVKVTSTELSSEQTKVGSNPTKSISWWVTTDPLDAFNLRHALTSVKSGGDNVTYPLMTALKSVYTCCNAFNVTYTREDNPTTYVKQRYSTAYLRKAVEIYRRELGPVSVLAHVSAKYDAMMRYGAATNNKTRIIEELVSMATAIGYDGLVYNYEPRSEYTMEHAEIYREFLNDLSAAMKVKGLTLGTVVSSWGILKYYDVFNSTTTDFFGSMSNTYYGDDVSENKVHVTEMLNSINIERLEVGLGLMHKRNVVPNPKRDYSWNEEGLKDFVTWIDARGVTRVHVYPGHWRSHKVAENYFLKVLSEFSKN